MTIVSGEVVPASTRTPIRGVKFIGENERWAAISDQGELELGMKKRMPAAWRLEHLAQSRMNKWGHCSFVSGELAEMLDIKGDTVKTILRTYKQNGIIAPESSQLCIVLSAERTQRADGMADILCADAMHAKKGLRDRMWTHNMGWEPEPGFLRTVLADKDRLANLRGVIASGRELSAREMSGKLTTTTTTTTTFEGTIREASVSGKPMCLTHMVPLDGNGQCLYC